MRLLIALVASGLPLSLNASTEADTASITGSFAPSKLIKPVNPIYPDESRAAGRAGWVRIAFCTDRKGAVTDLVVVDASRGGEFAKSVLDAVTQWRYQPASFEGKPIRQCGKENMLNFELPGSASTGVRSYFVDQWKSSVTLINEGRLDEAKLQIDALDPLNNYEYARILALRWYVARAHGNAEDELSAVNAVLAWRSKLDPTLLTDLLRRSLALNDQLGQTSAALASYTELMKQTSPTDEERAVGARLQKAADGDTTQVTPGNIVRRKDGAPGTGFWSATLLRSALRLEVVDGVVSRVEVRCPDRWYTAPFSADQVWRVPSDGAQCSAWVFGSDGAAFKLVEFAKD